MTIEFSAKFKSIYELKSKYHLKERIIRNIDNLEQNEFNPLTYSHFKDTLNQYIREIDCVENLDLTSFEMSLFYEQTNSLIELFKKVNNTNFVSSPDKHLAESYIGSLVNVGVASSNLFKNPKELLEIKLGDLFIEWSNEWEEANLKSSICKLKDEVEAELDYTDKYSYETIQCFMEAASAVDFVEAVSLCQYAMHGVIGKSHAQDL